MKLNAQDIKRLYSILTTCAIGDIDDVLIDEGTVRGVSPDRTCVIISDFEVPSFGNQKVGLRRLSALKSRMDLFMSNADAVLEAKETERGEISQLELSHKRNKVQFRCTATALIKAPRVINDENAFIVKIGKDQLQLLLNAIRVMCAKRVAVVIKKDCTVSIQAADSNNDSFTITLDELAEKVSSEDSDSVIHYFSSDVFTSILRAAGAELDQLEFIVGAGGTLTAIVNDHNMVIMPRVGEEE